MVVAAAAFFQRCNASLTQQAVQVQCVVAVVLNKRQPLPCACRAAAWCRAWWLEGRASIFNSSL